MHNVIHCPALPSENLARAHNIDLNIVLQQISDDCLQTSLEVKCTYIMEPSGSEDSLRASSSGLPATSFTTFGMFILDEIHWLTPGATSLPPKYDLVGGAGTYAALGARLVLSDAPASASDAKAVSWIVDVGSDFPIQVRNAIESWKTDCVFREDTTRLTTRAWNGYGEHEYRGFRYLTPKKRLEVSSLNDKQIRSRSFHMVCSAERCQELVQSLVQARTERDIEELPVIVWEPVPDLCSPAELTKLQQAAKDCTVISPNSVELRMFFPDQLAAAQEQLVHQLLGLDKHDNSQSSQPHTIVREGADGCTLYITSSTKEPGSVPARSIHLPAYHTTTSDPTAIDSAKRVSDPTGGGNTFLGALSLALILPPSNTNTQARTGNPRNRPVTALIQQRLNLVSRVEDSGLRNAAIQLVVAAVHALIAASYAIEQNGVPSPSISEDGATELWNGTSFMARTERYLDREADMIMQQME